VAVSMLCALFPVTSCPGEPRLCLLASTALLLKLCVSVSVCVDCVGVYFSHGGLETAALLASPATSHWHQISQCWSGTDKTLVKVPSKMYFGTV